MFAVVVAVGAVLRLHSLGGATLSADDTYSTTTAALPIPLLWDHVHLTDPHPPLSYLLLHPVVALGHDEALLRLPSALASLAAVVVMAVWQRDRGVAGLVATAVIAVAPFQILYARQVRMYGLLVLAGVVAAWAAQRWLLSPSGRSAVVAVVAGSVALWAHATGGVLLAGLLLLPGLRGDRQAWVLRGAATGSLAVFAVVWGSAVVGRVGDESFYPRLSPEWLSVTLNEAIAPVPSQRWLVLPLLAVGSVLLAAAAGPLRRVWVCLGVLPLAGLAVVSIWQAVLIPKSVVVLSWALALPLGQLAGEAWRRSAAMGVGVVALVALATIPSVGRAMSADEGAGSMVAAVQDAVAPGDIVVVRPGSLVTLPSWYLPLGGTRVTAVPIGLEGASALRIEGAPPTGRAWMVEGRSRVDPLDIPATCAERRDVGGGYDLLCVDADAVAPAP